MGDLNKQPAPSGDHEMPDVVRNILDEPMYQSQCTIKQYIGADFSNDTVRDAVQKMVNGAWKKINPLAKAPIIHDPVTPEDKWNIHRSVIFLALGEDAGEYPGDWFFRDDKPVSQAFWYALGTQEFDDTITSAERGRTYPFNITSPETSIDLHNKK